VPTLVPGAQNGLSQRQGALTSKERRLDRRKILHFLCAKRPHRDVLKEYANNFNAMKIIFGFGALLARFTKFNVNKRTLDKGFASLVTSCLTDAPADLKMWGGPCQIES
jgi:hypothetical protein